MKLLARRSREKRRLEAKIGEATSTAKLHEEPMRRDRQT